jgi:ribonuclease P protein component
MIGRLVQTADFERVLGTPSRARSVHFAVHHVASRPLRNAPKPARLIELSTDDAPDGRTPVDDWGGTPAVPAWWLGMVVPKRHAKRAVTRTLLKRQMRAAMERHSARLDSGLWVLRLRTPFDRQQFPSASSAALRAAVLAELDSVLARAARR